MAANNTSATGWEARFRIPRTAWARIAPRDPARGIYCSSVTGTYQIHRWLVGSSHAPAITANPTGQYGARLSPDGRWVVWHQDTGGDERGSWAAEPWEGGGRLVVAPGLPLVYSFTGQFSGGGSRFAAPVQVEGAWQLLVVEWAANGPGAWQLIDPGPGFASELAVDDDGTVACTTTGEAGSLETVVRIFGPDGRLRREVRGEGAVSTVAFAPDGSGRLLATTTRTGWKRPLIVDRAGGEAHFDLEAVAGDLRVSNWSSDGTAVAMIASVRAATTLHVLDVPSGAVRAVPHAPAAVAISTYIAADAATFLADGRILTTIEDGATPPRVVAVDPADGSTEALVDVLVDAPTSRPWRSIDIPSTDGTLAQGWLTVPEGDGPFPAIIEIHGGPEDQENDRYFPSAQAWVDRGYAVLNVNYRGSTGFGRAFEQAIWGDPGRRELDDVVAAREILVRLGIADPAAVVASGGSYGGYLTLLALTNRPELWAAGVAYVAIADWFLMWEDGEALRAYQEGLFGGAPEERRALYERASPVSRVAELHAPLLIVQGRNDPRCPPRQLEGFLERALQLGKRVEVDWFDAGHGHGGVEQRIVWQRRAMDFVDAALGRTGGPTRG